MKRVFNFVRRLWSRSLQFRTMMITGLITGIMILVAGAFFLTSVSEDLYSQRKDGVLQDSARATLQARQVIESLGSVDPRALNTAVHSMRATVVGVSSSDYLIFRRQAEQPRYIDAPQDIYIGAGFAELITPELTRALIDTEEIQLSQPIAFTSSDGQVTPGIAVGTTISLPGSAGVYDLILGYDLSDTQATYSSMLKILLLTAVLLMLLIGALVYGISRIVFRPIRVAAETSLRIAEGEEDARMPEQNDEYFDALAHNFNEMADSLQNRIIELDSLSEMQQRFVSDVSHELRTPLTTVKLATQVLSSNAKDMQQSEQRAIQIMNEQLERFESLLTDLLEISRYDAGRVSISLESTNLVALVEEVIEGLRPLSQSEIVFNTLGGFNPVDVDPRRLRRIVSNLIGNAVEHSENKPIEVTIDSNETAVAIGVRDHGVGMTPESKSHVFDRFWRADPSRKRTLGGTGLGLAIALEDAHIHGGLIDVWSKLGRGTHFRLTLPRFEDEQNFYSPLALIPEGESADVVDQKQETGWLQRPLNFLHRGRVS